MVLTPEQMRRARARRTGLLMAYAIANSARTSVYGSGTSGGDLLGSETEGLSIDFTNSDMLIRSALQSELQYSGDPFAKLTFSRGSPAKRFNSSGYLETVLSDVARVDYDPVTLAVKGFLFEETRTNLLQYSNTFAAPWTTAQTSLTSGAATSPDGTVNAYKLSVNAAFGVHTMYQQVGKAGSVSVEYAYSVYMKAAEYNWVALTLADFGGTPYARAFYNLSTGEVGTTGTGGVGWTFRSASMQSVGNGWYRCIITALSSAAGNVTPDIGPATADNTTNFAGTDGSGVYIYGAQLEEGTFPTSHITTTNASAARSADRCSIATSLFPYSATAGTLYVKSSTVGDYSTDYLAALSDGTANELIGLRLASSTAPELFVVDGGVTQAQIDAGSSSASAVGFAGGWAANDFAASYNGGAIQTDGTGSLPTMTTLYVGNLNGTAGTEINGHIQKLMYLPRRMTNTELVTQSAA